jgi:hypothetical protein
MSEITAASQEQSSGIEEVNRAIAQMDEMTQQNAALVEQAAAAAESMQEQSVNLAQAVAVFKLGASAVQMAPVVAMSKPPVEKKVSVSRPVTSRTQVAVAKPLSTPKRPTGGSNDEWEEF